jgi:hypothetical protein
MNIQTAITVGGETFVFDKTKCGTIYEACEQCALKELCDKDLSTATLCDSLGIARYDDYNFRRANAGEELGNAHTIPEELYDRLQKLGIIPNEVRDTNVGASDYSKHIIQPWAIWQDYNLNPWDADIVKRILRTKQGESRRLDYEKIIHICEERIRQIDS